MDEALTGFKCRLATSISFLRRVNKSETLRAQTTNKVEPPILQISAKIVAKRIPYRSKLKLGLKAE
jgi:hypothetical protein